MSITGDAIIDGFTIQDGVSEGSGAGILNRGNSVIANCVITYNHLSGENCSGAGIDAGSAIVKNCVIGVNNINCSGGSCTGAGITGSNATIINCTIVNNTISQGSALSAAGGGFAGSGTIINSILWGNTADRSIRSDLPCGSTYLLPTAISTRTVMIISVAQYPAKPAGF